jgi:hypothetical protein
MIDSYKKFFEGLKITREYDYEKAYQLLIDDLMEARDNEFDDLGGSFTRSYTEISPLVVANDYSPEEDFKAADEVMSKKGWSLENIKELKEHIPDLYDRICGNYQLSRSGGVDYYLYKITEGKWELGGGDPFQSLEEYEIKFGYGQHKTKYGMLLINQYGGMDRFIRGLADYYLKSPEDISDMMVRFIQSDIYPSKPNHLNRFTSYASRELSSKDIEIYDEEKQEVYIDLETFKSHFKGFKEIEELSQSEFDKIIVDGFNDIDIPVKYISKGDLKLQLGKIKDNL